ncbi:MAG: Mov34/MPN/PAD-1 family protein [Chloroflexota bacterium]
MVQALIEHARAEYPHEACGIIVGDRPAGEGGHALRWEPTKNEAASPWRYRIASDDLLRLTIETDDAGETFWAIVHSHVKSPAYPSPTDVGVAQYPDALYVLVSLAEDEADAASGRPSVRAFRIVDGAITEVELLVA